MREHGYELLRCYPPALLCRISCDPLNQLGAVGDSPHPVGRRFQELQIIGGERVRFLAGSAEYPPALPVHFQRRQHHGAYAQALRHAP